MLPKQSEFLMIGMSAEVIRFGDKVRKVFREDKDAMITKENIKAMHNEAAVYSILGDNPCIAKCLTVSPSNDYVELEFYPNGTVQQYVRQHQPLDLLMKQKWATQMIKSVAFIHDNGVIHSDLRLEQWLLDSNLDARLSDFNGSGYSSNNKLGLEGREALGLECETHYMPRSGDSTVHSDLFALASSLYELEKNERPFQTFASGEIEGFFAAGKFPSVKGCLFEGIILGCWKREFASAHHVLKYGEQCCGLGNTPIE